MWNTLQSIDIYLFRLINTGTANPLFDRIMPFLTNVHNWLLVYIFLLLWLLWKGGKRGRIAAAALIVVIILTDQLSGAVLKEAIGRIRPCHTLDNIRLLINCGKGKSFPSSHAANMFAAATVLSFFFRQYRFVYFGIAVTIAFSRVYVGVHYPFDIFGGACLGLTTGYIVIWAVRKIPGIPMKYNPTPKQQKE